MAYISRHHLFVALLIGLFFATFEVTFAQSPCGDIVGSTLFPSPQEAQEVLVIEDCADPFGVTTDPSNPYTVQINGEDIVPGATLALPDGRTNDISYTGEPNLSTVDTEIFKHVGNNYERVSLESSEPTESDYTAFAEGYFATQAERVLYIEITLYNFEHTDLDLYFFDSETGEDIIDEATGETVQSRYYAFLEAVYEHVGDEGPYLEAGTYTMLFYESQIEVTQRTIWDSVKDFLIPTAYAQCQLCIPSRFYTITFSIAAAPVEPAGASNILFLPGIMGSRLYEESSECADSGGEKQRWFSTNECEQLRLRTDFTGQSLNALYTKPDESAIIDDIFLVSPLYGDFLERLAEEKENGTIVDYRAVPYDWRLRLEDILKTKEENGKIIFDQNSSYQDSYIYKSLQELITSSESGKVTIVAHSNGGLVAKALLVEMEVHDDPLLEKIDNLILVAVPQVGTPDAVLSILHGAEIFYGVVISGEVSRQIVNTAPFSHHLLPSEQYFSGQGSLVQTPVVNIEPGSVTDGWRNQFGAEITTHEGLYSFLSKDSGRPKPDTYNLLQPEVVDNFLLSYADTAHVTQSAFVPSDAMKIFQVAGTGVGTPSSLMYFTDRECANRSILSFFRCTEYRDKLGYRAVFTADGDGTVVLPSALAMSETNQVGRVWVSLDKYNENNSGRVHRNILDVPDIQDFIFNTVEYTNTRPYNYLSREPVTSSEGSRLVFQLHSPLDMWVSTENGIISSTTSEVPGALYKRLGELQYIEVPASEDSVKVHLLGQKTGSFTLDIEHWEGTSLEDRIDFVAVPTATGTKVTAEIKSVLNTSVLDLDLEGNGTIDADMTAEGELTEKNVVSYQVLITTIEQLNIQRALKQALVTTIRSAEHYSNKKPSLLLYRKLEDALLSTSEELIRLYTKKRFISAADSKLLLEMIKVLKDKQ